MLVGERVVLRTVRRSDLDHLYELLADVRAMGDYWTPHIESEIKRRKRIEETGDWEADRGLLLITDHADRILGQIFFFTPASYLDAFELAYRIYKPEDWGQGYMAEAVSLLVAYIFEARRVSRIQATTLPGNRGSQGVLKKCGFPCLCGNRFVLLQQRAMAPPP